MIRSRYGAWRNAAGNMPWPPAAATAAGSSASLTTPAIGALWIGSRQPTRSAKAVADRDGGAIVRMNRIVTARRPVRIVEGTEVFRRTPDALKTEVHDTRHRPK